LLVVFRQVYIVADILHTTPEQPGFSAALHQLGLQRDLAVFRLRGD